MLVEYPDLKAREICEIFATSALAQPSATQDRRVVLFVRPSARRCVAPRHAAGLCTIRNHPHASYVCIPSVQRWIQTVCPCLLQSTILIRRRHGDDARASNHFDPLTACRGWPSAGAARLTGPTTCDRPIYMRKRVPAEARTRNATRARDSLAALRAPAEIARGRRRSSVSLPLPNQAVVRCRPRLGRRLTTHRGPRRPLRRSSKPPLRGAPAPCGAAVCHVEAAPELDGKGWGGGVASSGALPLLGA